MPKKPKSHRRPWTAQDMRVIKQFAKEKKTQREVAQALGRTPAAVQQKAFAEGIAFRSRKVTKAKAKAKSRAKSKAAGKPRTSRKKK